MPDIRPLPRGLDPLPEESLPGYLLRLAYRLDRSPSRIAALCGLGDRHGRIRADHLLALPSTALDVFARTARLSASEVNGLVLKCFVNTYPALARIRATSGQVTAVYSDNWVLNLSSRYCPPCLAGDTTAIQRALGGPWTLRWHLPIVFACARHHRLLTSTCPACGNLLNRSHRSHATLINRPAHNKLHPLQCRNTPPSVKPGGHRSRPCGARLDAVPGTASVTLPAEDLERMIALQQRLDHRLTPDQDTTTGAHAPEDSYFLDLAAAAQLIKLSWPAGRDLAPSDTLATVVDQHAAPINAALATLTATTSYARVPALWAAPTDTEQCGALLLCAETLLADREPASLRERVQPLARAAMQRAPQNAYRIFFSRSDFSPVLARALARKIHGFHAAGGSEHARLRIPSRDCHFTTEEVPPHLPQTWYDAHFTGFIDRMPRTTNWTVRHLRRAASLKLVEMTAGGSWVDCAALLDIPVGRANTALAVLRRQADGTDLWTDFETAVERIAHDLDNSPKRINYAKRRRALSTWRMSEADWAALCSGIPKFDRLRAKNDPSVGTVLAWAQVAQADHLLCPIITTQRHTGKDTKPLVNEVAQFLTPASQKGGRLELRHRLDHYAARLAHHCDIGAEPNQPMRTDERPTGQPHAQLAN